MGLAENQLSFDLLESWLTQNPDAAAFKRNGDSIFRELALFQDYHGLPAFKDALVQFMSEIRGNKVSFDSNKLVLTAGATSANETLMFCLADPGDAFLLPTPYYPGFDRDLKWRTGVEIVPIQCVSSNGFRITESALEEAYKEAESRNLRVKGVLVTNPSNPLGTTLTKKELQLLLNFVSTKQIHLISDEIFSGTVFNSPKFVSVMEVLIKNNYMCLESDAGLFCWVDMGYLLSSNTFDGEMELWKKIVYEVGLNISPGSSCHCTEPGWFRACLANMSEDTLNIAIQRLKTFVDSRDNKVDIQNQQQYNKKKSFSKWVFRLSFNERQRER
ncbi:hypothetical protein RDI58_004440 [Solanum bulbocastanum]|uniref:Aminotransferase class I/classII large domain-containing protein n=1 Tax=Solanum bulbocastanum TaxID=147425 RepID=A0AAN8U1C0_SOLBU